MRDDKMIKQFIGSSCKGLVVITLGVGVAHANPIGRHSSRDSAPVAANTGAMGGQRDRLRSVREDVARQSGGRDGQISRPEQSGPTMKVINSKPSSAMSEGPRSWRQLSPDEKLQLRRDVTDAAHDSSSH